MVNDSVFDQFLQAYWDHRDREAVEPLSFYLAKFPAAAAQIAEEYDSLSRMPGGDTQARRLGPFVLRREIGRGGQGVVYLAEDTRLQRRIALKVIPGEAHGSAERLARFERESRLASRLNHPAICPVHEAGQIDGLSYIAMQWIDGRSLHDHLDDAANLRDDERFPLALCLPEGDDAPDSHGDHQRLSRILLLVELVARGVHAAHAAGVLHRDLKPANVMVDRAGKPVLLDFGMSKDVSLDAHSLTESGEVLGTPSYMSPEQVIGDHRNMTPATDVYALGVLLFECLTLKRPLERENQAATLLAIRQSAPERIRSSTPYVPMEVETVVEKSLAKLVGQRFRSAEEFADELRRIRERQPIRTRAIHSTTRLWRWSQRNPKLASALLGLFTAITTGLIIALILLADVDRRRREAELIANATYLNRLFEYGETELLSIDPSQVAQFDWWIGEAQSLIEQRDRHLELAPELLVPDEEAAYSSWRSDINSGFLGDMQRFLDPASPDLGAYWRVRERAEYSRSVRQISIDDSMDLWAEAAAYVAAQDCYDGLEITPQLGLVPLGPDPRSRLAEFAVVHSGHIPARDESGHLELGEDSAVVLVLVPGGRGEIGLAADNGSHNAVDRLHVVELDPFFIGKFEVTRAQWASGLHADEPVEIRTEQSPRKRSGPTHPVADVSWFRSDTFARRLRLQLPTEAQWEYAFRCGSNAGSEPLAGNYADAGSAHEFSEDWSHGPGDDSWTYTAPCGTYPSNAWGIHDLGGNVEEWVRDRHYEYSEVSPRSGDGLRSRAPESRFVSARGGSFASPRPQREAAARTGDQPELRYWARVLRVARPVEK